MSLTVSDQRGIAAPAGERIRHIGLGRRLLSRPELGSVIGLIFVWIIFAVTTGSKGFLSLAATVNYLEVAGQVGVIATAVTLLMISGEFDLSVGSMVGFTSVIAAIAIGNANLPVPAVVLVVIATGLVLGFVNGYLVIRTRLPSFLVTLASMFILRGAAIGVTLTVAGTPIIGGFSNRIAAAPIAPLFIATLPGGVKASVIWWLVLAVLGAYILGRTTFGNWIFATGGSARAARAVGVPVDRVRMILFMAVGASAALLSVIQVLQFGSAEAGRGAQKEFEGIITAVIGGTLLTGGFGSPIGTVLGALTLAIARQGLFFMGVAADWYQLVLGLFLLASVLVNEYVRQRASESHR